ncbi:MAG: 2'-deoxycytidine 5'-triphosphate deaminase [Polyangiaceae bacterium]
MSPRVVDPATESAPSGVLVVQHLRHLVQTRVIHAETGIDEAQLQPNSLDLRLGRRAHRVRCSFLPGPQGVAETLRAFDADLHEFDLSQPAVLEPNVPYMFELAEQLDLPAWLSARANPKSSTGRLDIFARVVTDTGEAFDEIPAGYKGRLFVHVISRSFPVKVRTGDRLVQLRVSRGDPRLTDAETRELQSRVPMLFESSDLVIDDGIHFSAALSGEDGGVIGYRARAHTPLVDLANVGGHPIPAFWQVLHADTQRALVLDPDAFYVMASHERVYVPPEVCAEMVPFDAKSGELRTHYAGFFDSGFGQGQGARVVLEIRNRDTPFLLRDRQRIFRFQLHRNLAIPDTLYGDTGSHYQGQALRLAKQFA